ncbi:catalase family protein [Tianweitania populi]|uniref:Catalase n=1 Tax=Tianweitania populi TaxID=1607949 RepID=A0A8J3DV04_9HYPH|nr:catalase family protein [Tianweitania populi]GHD09562.1 catalase [Tianweitania populi]
MSSQSPLSPQRYSPAVDKPTPEEAEVGRKIDETMGKVREKTFEDSGRAIRSVHAKSHGILQAELEIDGNLPDVLAQGIFAHPGRHDVLMRFSTIPGDILPDSVSTPRGVAIKIFGVEGERLPDAEESGNQDFIMVNGPTFQAPDGKAFLGSLKPIAATTDRVEGLKKVVSAAARGIETVVEAVGGESAMLKSMGGQLETHILGDSFFSQLPVRFGDYIAKISIAPLSDNLRALTDQSLNVNGVPDGIREAVLEFFASQTAVWEIRAQLCTNLEDMPIEPANKEWSEEESPYVRLGIITAKPQRAWSEERSRVVDDGMGFNPWNGVEAHKPLGSLMRMRKDAYRHSQQFRSARNGTPVQEPKALNLP